MLTIKLEGCTVDGLRADMLKGQVKVTFATYLDDQVLEAKRTLALLAVDASRVNITIEEQQMRLPFGNKTPEGNKAPEGLEYD